MWKTELGKKALLSEAGKQGNRCAQMFKERKVWFESQSMNERK